MTCFRNAHHSASIWQVSEMHIFQNGTKACFRTEHNMCKRNVSKCSARFTCCLCQIKIIHRGCSAGIPDFLQHCSAWNFNFFFSISNTLYTYKCKIFKGGKSQIPDFYHTKWWNSRFSYCLLLKMSRLQDLFYKNLIWNSRQLPVLLWNSRFFPR